MEGARREEDGAGSSRPAAQLNGQRGQAAKGKARPRSCPGGVLRLHRTVLPQYSLCAQAVAESSPQEVRSLEARSRALSQPPLSLKHRTKLLSHGHTANKCGAGFHLGGVIPEPLLLTSALLAA